MKKILSLITTGLSALLFLMLFVGCKQEYPFIQDKSEISLIEIVSLKYVFVESGDPEEIIICEVENISDFLNDFSRIDFDYRYPPTFTNYVNTPTVVKITYENGEYEWICPSGKGTYRHSNESLVFHGTAVLNDDQFAYLITKYVGNNPVKLEYNFIDRITEISAIEIVKLGKSQYESQIPDNQTVIAKVEDTSEFLMKFAELDCFLSTQIPTRVPDDSIVIRISYNDGSYELISANGQSKSFLGDTYAFDGYRYFDKTQFSDFINEYISQS